VARQHASAGSARPLRPRGFPGALPKLSALRADSDDSHGGGSVKLLKPRVCPV
jgi:hypothetical protein